MTYLIIKLPTSMAQIRRTSYLTIIDYLTEHGFDMEAAEDIAAWANTASIGDHYEYPGATIMIG